MTTDHALRLLTEHKQQLHQRFNVRDVALFGSVARGESRPDSDVDVLVEFEGSPTFDGYMGTRFYLEDLLGVKVDLVTTGGLRPELRQSIEREAIHVS